MSDWRVELCRRSYDAFARLDIDAAVELYHPDCRWEMGDAEAAAGTQTYRGHAGLAKFVSDLGSVFPDWSPSIDDIRIRSDGAVVLRFTVNATGRDTGLKTTMAGGQVVQFRDDRILSVAQTDFPPPGWEDAQPVD